MNYRLLHIFRNTPLGRETLLQSLYFCKTVNAYPVVFIPKSDKFLMYFSNDAVQIDLDKSYMTHPETAEEHVNELFQDMGMTPAFYTPKSFTASTLPDVSTNFDYLSCPRSVSDASTKIGLGHIGAKVRRIVKHATFPVMITSPVFKPWKSITVLFGGSQNAIKALKLGLRLSVSSGLPLEIYTLMENKTEAAYRQKAADADLEIPITQQSGTWSFYNTEDYDEMLYDIRHDSLILLGAYGHGVIKDIFFGSKMERIQSTLSNNLLVIGPNCSIDLA